MTQSSDSFREHGPWAVRNGPTALPTPPPEASLALDVEPPPSSNGPVALRGDALARALRITPS